jgi:WbqC-like protein family
VIVAIHQPNFFPWLGYFQKLAVADCFILLDTVALPATGGHYGNRVQLLVQGRPAWVTAPLVRNATSRARIDSARFIAIGPWRRKILRTLEQNYATAPHFATIMPLAAALIATPTDSLRDFNLRAIHELSRCLSIDCSKIVLASTLGIEGKSTDLLVALVRAVGGQAYLMGGGASGYQDDAKFATAGIRVVAQNFRHPEYRQVRTPTFVPGLSILDALMNCGPREAASLLVQRCAPALATA